MVTKKLETLKSWSFSRYSDWKKCGLFFKLKHLDKIPEPGNDAMARGNAIHGLAEDYLKGKIAKLPTELALFGEEFKELRKLYKKRTSGMVVEDSWAFTNTWDRTVYNDWVGCWLRVKLDCAHSTEDGVMTVRDWKTGKFRDDKNEEYVEQLELYALTALILHPHIKEVRPELDYLDVGVIYPPPESPLVYTQADVPRLKKLWEKRVTPMFNEKRFAPKANSLCKFCWYGQSKIKDGGPGLCKM